MAGNIKFAPRSDDIELESIRRRRALAEAMQAQSMGPIQAPMSNGFVGRISPWQGIAKLGQAYFGAQGQAEADTQARGVQDARTNAMAEAFRQFSADAQGAPAQNPMSPIEPLPGEPMQVPEQAGDMRKAAMGFALNPNIPPQMQAAGMSMFMKQLEPEKGTVVGRSLLDPKTGKVIGTDATWQQEQEATRQAREAEALRASQARTEDIKLQIAARDAAGQRADDLRRELAASQRQQQEMMVRLAASMRPARQEPAPTITEIQDPTNPDRMIKVDARTGRQIGVSPNTKAAEQTERATERLAKQLEQAKVPQVSASINTLNNILAGFEERKESVPGMGYVKNLPLANIFLSEGGKDVKSSVQRVANDLLAMYSGLAVTLPEAERRALEEMRSGAFSADDFTRAWPATVGRFNQVMGNARAGYDPKIVQTYASRPGAVSLDPVVPAFAKKAKTSGSSGSFGGPSTPGMPSAAEIDAELARRGR